MKMKSSVFVAFLAILICCNFQVVQAASFDCKTASSNVEILICADRDLSALDSSLGTLYSSLKQSNPSLVNEQKQWLLKDRNICQTSACLIKAYSHRIKTFQEFNNCPKTENVLLGGWIVSKGEGPFEEMQFSIADGKKQFTSWRHHRLEIIGAWKLEQCMIHVKHNTEEALQYSMKIKKIKNNKLYLFDSDSQSEVVYKFVKQPLEQGGKALQWDHGATGTWTRPKTMVGSYAYPPSTH